MMSTFSHPIFRLLAATLAVAAAGAARPAAAQGFVPGQGRMEPAPDALKNVSVDEKLDTSIPLDLTFEDDAGQKVELRKYFTGNRPVVLQLGYYGCPMLCDLVSQRLADSLKTLTLDAGKDFDVVFVSIDPNESSTLAAGKKRHYVDEYNRPGTEGGWHFLVGKAPQVEALAKAVGFNYTWVPSAQQYSHPAAVILLTPQGKVSRYLYFGGTLEEKTLRLSLVEASEGKIGTTMEHFLLRCFQYDGRQGRYAFTAMAVMRAAGVLTVAVLAFGLYFLFRRDPTHKARAAKTGGGGDDTTTTNTTDPGAPTA
jgi:protein SCO1/2